MKKGEGPKQKGYNSWCENQSDSLHSPKSLETDAIIAMPQTQGISSVAAARHPPVG